VERDAPPLDYRTRYLRLRSVLHDRTTGLPAFPVLIDRLRTLLDDRREIGVLHLTPENLDLVESLYGWQVYDRVRARIAFVLRESLGGPLPQGALLALSGVADDRFVAFIPARSDGREVEPAFLARTGEELCKRLREAFDDDAFAGLSPRIEFRAGHALISQSPFYRFERRVYGAIDEARSYDERRRASRESSWDGELRRIIRDSAVDTVFQPVVDLRTRAVLGFEAFARGPRDSAFEQPNALFSLSDRFGVAADLDRICREAALRALALSGRRGKVFLNALPRSVTAEPWPSAGWVELLEAVPLDRDDLVLEFSERAATEDVDGFARAVESVRGAGFGVALDDIGTGWASQAVLQRVRPDYLKLDVTLVRDIHRDLIKQELLASVIRIAEQLGAVVIAEGVETADELAVLVEAGARYGQGFLFAEPAPASALGAVRPAPTAPTDER
jgi:EAL domain-containing protein (putative c-di-GMP-specific phosphodiesterase class I)/GGDEF domain-containing protein